jgi:cytoskeleton protein RodZ
MAAEERVESAPDAAPSQAGPGARLQAAREAAGLSLEQVAQQLKLAPRQVRALEEEDFAQLPGRTFARGFVRNYARLLNLDGDDLLALLPDAARAPALGAPALQSTGAMIAELPTANGVQPGFARWVIPIALVACIVGAATYEWYRGGLAQQGEPKLATPPAPAAPAAPPVPAATAPVATTRSELPNPFAAEPEAGTSAAGPVARAAEPEVAAAPNVAPAAPPAAAAAPPPSVASTAPPAPAAALPAASLKLSYRGPSWTEIRDRDGQVLISRLVAAGSEQSIRGTPPFDVIIGNANEVTLVYRGAPVDLSRYTRQNVARLRLT